MANALYRKLPSGDWMNQANPGGPSYFRIQFDTVAQQYFTFFTYDGNVWFQHTPGAATVVAAQAGLDTYVGNLNAGTA